MPLPANVDGVAGLVLLGAASTTVSKPLVQSGLGRPVRERAEVVLPIRACTPG
ncbi:MAG: hypothetical protein AVDCRST_MAG19-5014 [uncultured Thermomicrobiales bacterium]|uniref:Uncharacterized protein n=1 Tax=uncultured Thermomicrobiales bacterium TaxID=1645740 RepID=A0A6J4VSS9_9BACT|nr:MAG: hypothetical protein AVDCRST_MAG19-5014 [uncultured Thermomicrobiales bacterium]